MTIFAFGFIRYITAHKSKSSTTLRMTGLRDFCANPYVSLLRPCNKLRNKLPTVQCRIGHRRASPARVILEQDVFDRSFPSRSFAALEDDTMGREQRAKTSPRRISGGRKCKRITLKPVGTVRPCNKLPAVQGCIGRRRTFLCCPKA